MLDPANWGGGARHPARRALVQAALFGCLSLGWIILSDELASHIADNVVELAYVSKLKGSAFVAITSVLVGLLIYRVECKRTELEQAVVGLQRDYVTGIPNRTSLEAVAQRRCQLAVERTESFGLVFVDLINLERINASLGRSAGDMVLRESAHRLVRAVRDGDFVARLESDKFVALLRLPSEEQEARGVGHRIISLFEESLSVDGLSINLDLHVGVSMSPIDGRTPQQLIDAAARASRDARRLGHKNTVTMHQSSEDARSTLEIEGALRQALVDRALVPYFQPQVAMPDGEIVGAEALVRWPTEDGPGLSPREFIPVAEASGLIGDLTEAMLEQTCAWGADWLGQGFRPLQLSVNLSGMDLTSDRIVQTIERVLQRTRLPGNRLALEITESRFMDDPESAITILKRLQQYGVRISIDDFGTGYSSLSYLNRFPLDALKIDRSFVAQADMIPAKRTVLDAICSMATALGLETIAEGVETPGEARLVQELGCNRLQGYLAAPPLAPEEFAKRFLSTERRVRVGAVADAVAPQQGYDA